MNKKKKTLRYICQTHLKQLRMNRVRFSVLNEYILSVDLIFYITDVGNLDLIAVIIRPLLLLMQALFFCNAF